MVNEPSVFEPLKFYCMIYFGEAFLFCRHDFIFRVRSSLSFSKCKQELKKIVAPLEFITLGSRKTEIINKMVVMVPRHKREKI